MILSISKLSNNYTQHIYTQRNCTQHIETQHNATKHNNTQHDNSQYEHLVWVYKDISILSVLFLYSYAVYRYAECRCSKRNVACVFVGRNAPKSDRVNAPYSKFFHDEMVEWLRDKTSTRHNVDLTKGRPPT
jgi:hypothetical protein